MIYSIFISIFIKIYHLYFKAIAISNIHYLVNFGIKIPTQVLQDIFAVIIPTKVLREFLTLLGLLFIIFLFIIIFAVRIPTKVLREFDDY